MKTASIAHRMSLYVQMCFAVAVLLSSLWGCGKAGPQNRTAPAPEPATKPLFADVAEQSGVRFLHQTGKLQATNIMSTTGTGCAVFDYDNDGWLDIYLVNGSSPPGDGNHLYHNNHDGTFTDVTARAGVAGTGHGFGMGVAVGDFDGDGWLDFYVTNYGKNILFHNKGNGTFEDVTQHAGVAGGGFSTTTAFADLDGDGYPDLYVARYCVFDAKTKQLCNVRGVPASCPPYFYTPEPDFVYKNNGDGTFRRVEKAWGMGENTGRGLGIVTVDYDHDGKLDVFVANDGTPNFLYHNLGHGAFKNEAATQGVAMIGSGSTVANMGCDFGDYTNTGNYGCVTGTFDDEELGLWNSQKDFGFQYTTRTAGLSEVTRPLLTFGVGFADFNNDGMLDLFLANGHVNDRIKEIDPSKSAAQPRTYLENIGAGKFQDKSKAGGPAVMLPRVGRGIAFGDLFNDGGMAMVINNSDGPAMILRNDMPRQNWVELRLLSKGSNWEAIGATAELYVGNRKLMRFVHTSYSFASANDPRLHFGLGHDSKVDKIVITWPGGHKTEHHNIAVNQISTLVEPGARLAPPLRRFVSSH